MNFKSWIGELVELSEDDPYQIGSSDRMSRRTTSTSHERLLLRLQAAPSLLEWPNTISDLGTVEKQSNKQVIKEA